jgi:hypothetical protein
MSNYKPPHSELKKFLADDYMREKYEQENQEYTEQWYAEQAREHRKNDVFHKPYSEISTVIGSEAEKRQQINEAYEKSWKTSEKQSKTARRRNNLFDF